MKTFLMTVLCLSICGSAFAVELKKAIEAAGHDKVAVLKQYKAEKKDLNAQDDHGINPLMQAAATGQKAAVQYLLSQKPNLELKNDADDTALAMAIGNEQDDIAVLLINAGAKIDVLSGDQKSTMAFLPASVNSEKALNLLVKKAPAQINTPNKKGDTAMHEAVRFGTPKTMQTLIKAGAKKDIKNAEGKTPLELAKSLKNEEAIQLLK
ncbi:MAG: ankyrin repeat domain-containing protein [Bdellovibrionaceae bacterium]|nr:ankyrin repeat domain-containing protein [Pseudobdellovibrionaceae bacterium]